jgi:uncharacterized protein DUF3667
MPAPAVTAPGTSASQAIVTVGDATRALPDDGHCANCGAAVTGRYCAACGQRRQHAIHSTWHFVQETAEDLTHADSRLWRTLAALLARPGFLTREFLEGRRVRYLPPVRLYLVLSVIYFLILALVPQTADNRVQFAQISGSEITVHPVLPGATRSAPVDAASAKRFCASFPDPGPWASRLRPRIEANCLAMMSDNGQHLRQAMLHNAGRAMFLLLPLLALVMKVLYRRPARHYVEHLLFFVHNHSFLFLILGTYALLTGIGPTWLRSVLHPAMWIYTVVYFYVSMLRVYGQGWLRTATKLGLLGCAYIVLGALMATITFAYSFLTL